MKITEWAKTRDNFSIWNVWPCGCYNITEEGDVLSGNFCKHNPTLDILAPQIGYCDRWNEQGGCASWILK
jgi:hypothetical protein